MEYCHRGLFPGPKEEESAFFKRVARAVPQEHLLKEEEEALLHVQTLFDIAPDWIPILSSNERLCFWEAAATWYGKKEDGTLSVVIQIPKGRRLTWVRYFVSMKEILSHEMIHAVRLHCDEGRFEEILAYQTATSPLRRYFGPLWQSTFEMRLFLSTLVASCIVELLLPLYFWIALSLPFLFLGFLILRLIYRQRLFSRAQKYLAPLLKNSQQPLAVLLRMSAAEIALCAKGKRGALLDYIALKREDFRWKMILCYFRPLP